MHNVNIHIIKLSRHAFNLASADLNEIRDYARLREEERRERGAVSHKENKKRRSTPSCMRFSFRQLGKMEIMK
jgi:hypothetical protein